MGNYNLFNNLVKEIPTNLRRLIARRLKRFNFQPRAFKVIEKIATDRGERAPFPKEIQQKIEEALKNEPDLLQKVTSDRNETLLERLKNVFVSSFGDNKDMFNKTRLTPMQYNLFEPEKIEEYKETIPEGKFSLKQADAFLREFQNNPNMSAVESLSEKLKIDPNRIMCMLTHTKVFKAVAPINRRSETPTYFQRASDFMLPSIIETEPDEEKMYRILDRRSKKFQQYYKEKLGMPDQQFVYQVKNPATKKLLVKLDILEDDTPSVTSTAEKKSVVKKGAVDSSEGGSKTILVSDLKPGEDPNAWEEMPKAPAVESMGEYLELKNDPTSTREEGSLSIHAPEDEKFDVFRVMEEQDRKARKEKRRLEKMKQKEKGVVEEFDQVLEPNLEEEKKKIAVRDKISSEST